MCECVVRVGGLLSHNKCIDSQVFLCDEKILKQVMLEELKKKEQHLTPQKEPLNAVVIDYYLWDFAKKHSKELETIPIHKTRTIFY